MKVIIKKVANLYGVLADNGETFIKGFDSIKKAMNYCKKQKFEITEVL